MKTKILHSLFILFVCSFLTVTEAYSQDDTKRPVITLIAPGEGHTLQTGKAIHFDMDLADDTMLESYRVEIHNNFDGHSHTKANEGSSYPSIFNKTWDVSGSKSRHIHHHGITIPADAAEGNYHFVIYCKDAAGNESSVIRNVTLSKEAGTTYHH